jgi:hypothetical protein
VIHWLSNFLDRASNYFASRKGLLPFIGLLLVICNILLVSIFPEWGISRINLALHLGVIIAIIGQMLAWVL